ncbi:MAG: heme-degrading domain-containing protein [Spirochaetaceae bacterium]|nr:MAG: heme-degrading domain-containing protein [Spirochaetaceae bacterium]
MARNRKLDARIKECEGEEEELQFSSFTNEEALQLGLAMVERAKQRGLSVAIDIERHGQQLFHHALEGTATDNDKWIARKKLLVNRVFMSSYHFTLKLEASGGTLRDRGLDEQHFAASGGSFPVRIQNTGVVGTITVSGLPHEQDHALVVESVRRFLAR